MAQSPEKQEQDIDITAAIEMRHDNVLVKRSTKLHVTKGGLVVPHQADRAALPLGEVVKVGPGRILQTGGHDPITDLKPGDKVIYGKMSGKPIDTTQLPEYFMLRDHEIVSRIPEALFHQLTEGHKQEHPEVDNSPAPRIQVVPG